MVTKIVAGSIRSLENGIQTRIVVNLHLQQFSSAVDSGLATHFGDESAFVTLNGRTVGLAADGFLQRQSDGDKFVDQWLWDTQFNQDADDDTYYTSLFVLKISKERFSPRGLVIQTGRIQYRRTTFQ